MENPVQEFEICLLHESGYIYDYALTIDTKGIVRESLSRQSKRKGAKAQIFTIKREKSAYRYVEGKAEKQVKTILKNGNSNLGLFVSKLALIGLEDAGNVVGWVLNNLYPRALWTDSDSDVKKGESDLEILKDITI